MTDFILIPNHATLPDMPSATNPDHDARYVNLDGESVNITNGTFDLTTTGLLTMGSLKVDVDAQIDGSLAVDGTTLLVDKVENVVKMRRLLAGGVTK